MACSVPQARSSISLTLSPWPKNTTRASSAMTLIPSALSEKGGGERRAIYRSQAAVGTNPEHGNVVAAVIDREQQAVIPPEAQGWERRPANSLIKTKAGSRTPWIRRETARPPGGAGEGVQRNKHRVGARKLSPRGMRNNSKQRRACRTMDGTCDKQARAAA